jgi:hypothetical protein
MLGVGDVTVVLALQGRSFVPNFMCAFPIRLAPGKISVPLRS